MLAGDRAMGPRPAGSTRPRSAPPPTPRSPAGAPSGCGRSWSSAVGILARDGRIDVGTPSPIDAGGAGSTTAVRVAPAAPSPGDPFAVR